MRKKTKCALIVATALTLLGIIILTGVMSMLRWDFKKLSTVGYETNTYEITDVFQSVEIRTGSADVIFLPTLDDVPSVVCYERQKVKHTVAVEEGVLVIEAEDLRRWYDRIGFDFYTPSVTVYLPVSQQQALTVFGTTGNVTIAEDLVIEGIDVTLTTGNIRCYASATGDIRLSTTTGNIYVEDVRAGDVTLSASMGNLYVEDVFARNATFSATTGNAVLEEVIVTATLSVTLSTGDIRLDEVDGAELFFKTTTGNVRGSLCTPKTFTVSQSTGTLRLPQTTGGGKCEIVTSTGNIKITLADRD